MYARDICAADLDQINDLEPKGAALEPRLEPLSVVLEQADDCSAINYCIDQAIQRDRNLRHWQIADQLKIGAGTLTKIRQGENRLGPLQVIALGRATGSWLVLQLQAMHAGLILKSRKQEKADQDEIKRLRDEVEHLRRVAGVGNDNFEQRSLLQVVTLLYRVLLPVFGPGIFFHHGV